MKSKNIQPHKVDMSTDNADNGYTESKAPRRTYSRGGDRQQRDPRKTPSKGGQNRAPSKGDGPRKTYTKEEREARKAEYEKRKEEREARKAEYEKRLRLEGRPCVYNYDWRTKKSGTCNNYTLRGDFCNSCFQEARPYIVGPCRNRTCCNRVLGGRGFCSSCDPDRGSSILGARR